MEYKYKIILEEDKRTISFGKWKIDCYNDSMELPKSTKARYVDICHSVFAENHINPNLKYYTDKKTLYTTFTKEFGISPSRFVSYIKKLQYKAWCDGIDAKVLWACCGKGSYKRELDRVWLKRLPERKEKLKQLKNDGILHLAPWVFHFDNEPNEIKKKLGKGSWKKICKNSLTRNSLLAIRATNRVIEEGNLTELLNYPSTALKYVGFYDYIRIPFSNLIREAKISTKKHEINRLHNIVRDTIRLLMDLGKDHNPNWSYKRWQEEHDKASKEILTKKYSPVPFDEDLAWCLITGKSYSVLPREFTCESGTAKLLMSSLEVAQEGSKMHHCVGSYADWCAKGKYAVYHITDVDGKESTLGLNLSKASFGDKTEDVWFVQQHYSYQNSKVSDKCEKVRNELCLRGIAPLELNRRTINANKD